MSPCYKTDTPGRTCAKITLPAPVSLPTTKPPTRTTFQSTLPHMKDRTCGNTLRLSIAIRRPCAWPSMQTLKQHSALAHAPPTDNNLSSSTTHRQPSKAHPGRGREFNVHLQLNTSPTPQTAVPGTKTPAYPRPSPFEQRTRFHVPSHARRHKARNPRSRHSLTDELRRP